MGLHKKVCQAFDQKVLTFTNIKEILKKTLSTKNLEQKFRKKISEKNFGKKDEKKIFIKHFFEKKVCLKLKRSFFPKHYMLLANTFWREDRCCENKNWLHKVQFTFRFPFLGKKKLLNNFFRHKYWVKEEWACPDLALETLYPGTKFISSFLLEFRCCLLLKFPALHLVHSLQDFRRVLVSIKPDVQTAMYEPKKAMKQMNKVTISNENRSSTFIPSNSPANDAEGLM